MQIKSNNKNFDTFNGHTFNTVFKHVNPNYNKQ